MKLIIGLGNPGPEYAQTRHNAGFLAVERIAELHGWRFNQKRAESQVAEGEIKYVRVVLAKPQTYMNNSGFAAARLMQSFRVNPTNMRQAERLGARQLHFTAVSRAIRDTGVVGGGTWHVVYNSAEPSRYTFRADVDPEQAPLVFLGRFERCKGAHAAIDVAQRTGRTLLLAEGIGIDLELGPLGNPRAVIPLTEDPIVLTVLASAVPCDHEVAAGVRRDGRVLLIVRRVGIHAERRALRVEHAGPRLSLVVRGEPP